MDKELRDAILSLCAIVFTVTHVWNFIDEKRDRAAALKEANKAIEYLSKAGRENDDIRRIKKKAAKERYELDRPKSEIEWSEKE